MTVVGVSYDRSRSESDVEEHLLQAPRWHGYSSWWHTCSHDHHDTSRHRHTWWSAINRTCTGITHALWYRYENSAILAADCGVQSPFIRAMGGRYLRCATCVIAGQYATSSCKPLLVWFPCMRRYINVRPLTFLTFKFCDSVCHGCDFWTLSKTQNRWWLLLNYL